MTHFISFSEEVAVKQEAAREAWRARKVQVLVEDDEIPPGHELALPLENLVNYLETIEVPTQVIIDLDVYRVKLRKRVSREEYREILEGLRRLSWARWDRRSRAILVDRTHTSAPEEEEIEVEEIVVTPKGVKT
ncbi:hypothetical protein [Thermococcus sp.]|uniref:hypothetical protein n=1 Tax=Thermococcus sp. TaxID=35749 RepID=UPI0025FBD9BB|nr:hypothetical protein [Thermococcus sp.]